MASSDPKPIPSTPSGTPTVAESPTRGASPSSSPGSQSRKRQREEDAPEPGSPPDEDTPVTKKRRTPPTDTTKPATPATETPRTAKGQARIRKAHARKDSATSPPAEETAIVTNENDGSRPAAPSASTQPDAGDMSFEMTETPPVEGVEDETAAVVGAMGGTDDRTSPNKVNGAKKTRRADGERPIEVDSSEKTLKRKASNRPPGSPSGPLQKRLKDDEGSVKSTVIEEHPELETTKPAPDSQSAAASAPAPKLAGFSAFASMSPFASLQSTNAPFAAGPSKSTIFGSTTPSLSGNIPSISWASALSSNANALPNVFTPKGTSDAKDSKPESPNGSPKPKPKSFSSPSLPTTTQTPKFGTTSAVGQGAGSIYNRSVFAPTLGAQSASLGSPSAAGPTRRAKSPRPQAFGAYSAAAGGSGRFVAPSSKIKAKSKSDAAAAEAEKEKEKATSDADSGSDEKSAPPADKSTDAMSADEGATSTDDEGKKEEAFGDMLARAGPSDTELSDSGEKIVFTEQKTMTGEEGELNVFHGKGKLYYLPEGESQWKERGAGTFRLNVDKSGDYAPRMIMRRDGSLNLLLNARLFKGMRCVAGPDPRYISFVILDEEKKPQSHLLRFNTSKIAQDLLERLQSHIPK